MLPFVHIDQVVLQHWRDRIDYNDAALIAFIETLKADNELVARHMQNGYFLLNRQFVLDALSLLGCAEDQLSRKIKHLADVGIIDRMKWVSKTSGKYCLYVRLSKLYYQVKHKAYRKIDDRKAEAAKPDKELEATSDKNVHGRFARMPSAEKSNDHLNDHKRAVASPALGGGDAPAKSDGEPPIVERIPEEEWEAVSSRLPWRQAKSPAASKPPEPEIY